MRAVGNVSATIAGTCTFMAQVSGSVAGCAEFHGSHEDDVVELRQPGNGAPVEKVAGDRLDARRIEGGAGCGIGEARDAHHAFARCSALGQAGQRRSHLACRTEDQDVPRHAREIVHQRRRRLGHEVFERGDALEPLRQMLGAHAAFSGLAGAIRPCGGVRMGCRAAKSMSAATAKPGQPSEPSWSRPLSMRRRAGPPARL